MGRYLGPFLGCLLSGGLLLGAPPKPELQSEVQRKVSTINLLADYVTWPKGRETEPLLIGVLGPCPIGVALQESRDLHPIQERRVRVATFRNLYGLDRCDILFICGPDTEQIPEILKFLRGKPILTISDSPGMGEAGVMVNLVLEKDRLKLEVNLSALRRSGLDMNSRVLNLAKIVE